MAIDFTSNPGGLFPRLGRIGKILLTLNQNQAAVKAQIDNLQDQYDSTLQAEFGPVAEAQFTLVRNLSSQLMPPLAALARKTVISMVRADVPSIGGGLLDALTEVRRQMLVGGVTVKRCVVGAAVSALPGFVGTGQVVLSSKRGDGLQQENMIAEVGRLVCTRDSYSGGATAGQETFTYFGEDTENASVYDWDWPQGSGSRVTISVVSASQGPDQSNLLANGDFETWSGSPLRATNWELAVGSWGTHAIQDNTAAYTGQRALRLTAGATLTELYQEYLAAVPVAQQSYAIRLMARKYSGTITAGTLAIDWVDDAGVVINDQQGQANTFTVDLTTLTTTYTAWVGVFRLPKRPPGVVRLRIRLTTALAGGDVLLDGVVCTPLRALSRGGPGVAIIAGNTPFEQDDTWLVTTTNDRGGASYLATFQALFDRLFGMRELGLLLPSSATPSISDTLITS